MNIEDLSAADGLTIADIDRLTRVPTALAHLFPDFEVFKTELKQSVEALQRNEELMAQMFTDQTEASMRAVRLEVQEIAAKMNAVMRIRFTLPSGMPDMKSIMIWGVVMGLFTDKSTLTSEQRVAMIETGAFSDLMRTRVSV